MHGFARCVSYLNCMQEAAFDASAAAGWNLDRYAEIGCHWLVRETDIRYQRQLRYGDSVLVKTWVADFRRVRSRRAYQLWGVESGELVAEASTDWVFLDSNTGLPARIPREMMEAFFPEGVPDQGLPRNRFPGVSAVANGAFSLGRRVVWSDVDPARHVNNAVYLAYLEDSVEQAVAARGWPHQRIVAEGIALVPSRHQIEYRQPAVLGDELELTVWLSDLTDSGGVWRHAVVRIDDGARLADAHTHWACVDAASRLPSTLPAQLAVDLNDLREKPR